MATRAVRLLLVACRLAAAQSAADEMQWLPAPKSGLVGSDHFDAARKSEARGDFARAIAEYRGALAAGRQVDHCVYLVRAYISLRELQAAETAARECLAIDASIPARLSLIFVFQEQGRFSQAAEALDALRRDGGNRAFASYLSGRNYQGLNMPDRATAEYLEALKFDPGLAQARFRLGLIYSQQRSTYKDALQCFEQALALGYAPAAARKEMGSVRLKSGDWQQAILELTAAARHDPGNLEAYYQLSRAHLQAGDTVRADEALKRYKDLQARSSHLSREMSRAHALYQRGVQLMQEREFASAEAAFQEALGDHSINDLCYYGIAEASLLRGQYSAAEAAIRKSVQLRPHEPAYHFLSARILSAAQKRPEALAAAERAIALSPDHAEFHDFAGRLYLAAGAPEKAAEAHREAIRLKPGDPYFHLNLSQALEGLSRVEESAQEKQTYLRLLSASQKRPNP